MPNLAFVVDDLHRLRKKCLQINAYMYNIISRMAFKLKQSFETFTFTLKINPIYETLNPKNCKTNEGYFMDIPPPYFESQFHL